MIKRALHPASCYFVFCDGRAADALSIARRHTQLPVAKKRKLFTEIEQQLMELSAVAEPLELQDEFSADPAAGPRDPQDRERELGNLAASEPSLDFRVTGSGPSAQIEISATNCRRARLHFYRTNVELMHSAAPFIISDSADSSNSKDGSGGRSFLFVTPNLTLELALPQPAAGSRRPEPLRVAVPEEFRQSNCWIELTDAAGPASAAGSDSASGSSPAVAAGGVRAAGAGGLSVVRPFFAHQLHVQLTANYGQLKVVHAESGRPLQGQRDSQRSTAHRTRDQ